MAWAECRANALRPPDAVNGSRRRNTAPVDSRGQVYVDKRFLKWPRRVTDGGAQTTPESVASRRSISRPHDQRPSARVLFWGPIDHTPHRCGAKARRSRRGVRAGPARSNRRRGQTWDAGHTRKCPRFVDASRLRRRRARPAIRPVRSGTRRSPDPSRMARQDDPGGSSVPVHDGSRCAPVLHDAAGSQSPRGSGGSQGAKGRAPAVLRVDDTPTSLRARRPEAARTRWLIDRQSTRDARRVPRER